MAKSLLGAEFDAGNGWSVTPATNGGCNRLVCEPPRLSGAQGIGRLIYKFLTCTFVFVALAFCVWGLINA